MTQKNPLQPLIDAPLANALKVNTPAGRRSTPRAKKPEYQDEIGCPKASAKELRERKAKADLAKLETLFDYYAGTNLTSEKIAEHMGLYRNEQTGVSDDGKPIMTRVLDVGRAEAEIAWRRKAAA